MRMMKRLILHLFPIAILILLCCSIATKTETNVRKIILDTDGGADDVTALLQVAQDPNTTILAIICVYGNVEVNKAADNILRTLNLIGRTDIPVYVGCDSPLITNATYDSYFGPDGIGNASQFYPVPENVTVKSNNGVLQMVEIVNNYPGEVTLLNLGPLTNVAVASKLDPLFSSKLKDHMIMGGTMRAIGNIQPTAEFNLYDDVEAATMVFLKTAFPIRVVPYELCLFNGPTWEWYDNWIDINTTKSIFIDRVFSVGNYKARTDNETFDAGDFLASTILLHPEVVISSTLRVAKIEECGFVTRGELAVDYRSAEGGPDSNVDLITKVDMNKILNIWQNLV